MTFHELETHQLPTHVNPSKLGKAVLHTNSKMTFLVIYQAMFYFVRTFKDFSKVKEKKTQKVSVSQN